MKRSSHSEYAILDHLVVKGPEQAYVSQETLDRQWKELNYLSRPDFKEAVLEYRAMLSILRGYCQNIDFLPEAPDSSPDSIYCRDASIATDYGMIICNMGKNERMAEPEAQRKFFDEKGIKVLGRIELPGTLEGGDVAWLDERTLAVGRTYRTNDAGIRQLKSFLEPHGIEIIVADLPHYKGQQDVFHLMSILSPIDANLAVVFSPLMPIRFREELLSRGFELVEVPEEEFESMGCNVLAVAPRVCIMVEGNPKTEQQLKLNGCRVFR